MNPDGPYFSIYELRYYDAGARKTRRFLSLKRAYQAFDVEIARGTHVDGVYRVDYQEYGVFRNGRLKK